MATSVPSNTQEQDNASEKVAQQFLSAANDYFRSEIKCMFSFLSDDDLHSLMSVFSSILFCCFHASIRKNKRKCILHLRTTSKINNALYGL